MVAALAIISFSNCAPHQPKPAPCVTCDPPWPWWPTRYELVTEMNCAQIKADNHWSCPRISTAGDVDYILSRVAFAATVNNANTYFHSSSDCEAGTAESSDSGTLSWIYGDPRFLSSIPVEEWESTDPTIPRAYGGAMPLTGKQLIDQNAPLEILYDGNSCRPTTDPGKEIFWMRWSGAENWNRCLCVYSL